MKSGTKRLSESARKVVVPTGITSTGWPAVRDLCEKKLGLGFDDWQHGAGRVIMAERKDGTLAAMIDGVGMSLPRQVGKTYLLAAIIFALCILRPGLLVIWSAHHAKTHNETFLAMQAFAERSKIAPYIRRVYTGSGDEEVRFLNTSRILFGARERGFGRGIPGVDVLVFDEAQILSDRALSNMLATLNTSRFGLSFFIGTPPRPEDDSEVFQRLRDQAYAGELTDGAWIEFGAEDDADPNDRKQWAVANPSYPKRTPAESILRLQRKLKPDDFRREGLGIWGEFSTGGAFKSGLWGDLADPGIGSPESVPAIGLAGSPDGLYGAIGSAVSLEDGRIAVAPVDYRQGQRWLIDEARRIQDRHGCAVVVYGKGPLSYLVKDLEAVGVEVTVTEASDWVAACEDMWRRAQDGSLVHPGDPELSRHVLRAGWRKVGDRRAFDLKAGVPLLEAVTWAARVADERAVSVYETRGALTL